MTVPHDINSDHISKLQSEMSAAVKAHWKAFLFEGFVLAVLGLAAMIVPPLAPRYQLSLTPRPRVLTHPAAGGQLLARSVGSAQSCLARRTS